MVRYQARFINSYSADFALSNVQGAGSRVVQVAWTPPPSGCYKINVEGSHIHATGSSTCGGLVRDSQGRFVRSFYCPVGVGNALRAEIWGLQLGLKLAQQLQLRWVLFELDSDVLVRMINSGHASNARLQPLLLEIINTLHQPGWRASVVHAYREANQCADLLAR